MNLLVLNAGSSSHKVCLFDDADTAAATDEDAAPPVARWKGRLDWSHHAGEVGLKITTRDGREHAETLPADNRRGVLRQLLSMLWEGECGVLEGPGAVGGIGHRVVHGGADLRETVRVNDAVRATVRGLEPLAPDHDPAALEGMEVATELFGKNTPQFAAFDTAFHRTLPDAAAVPALPAAWVERFGLRRYGFHGISHGFVAGRAAAILGRPLGELRLITCHLGNGCSLAAVSGGRSVDTTMGFTPLDGLVMGTRAGSVDPGLLLHLMREEGKTADELFQALNHESGLKGIYGPTGDARAVAAAMEAGDARARLAFDVFIHSLRRHLGAMFPALGGDAPPDALVFTGGIGENQAAVRTAACAGLGFLGLRLDDARNAASPVDVDVADAASTVRVLVIRTDEEWAIARDCCRLLAKKP